MYVTTALLYLCAAISGQAGEGPQVITVPVDASIPNTEPCAPPHPAYNGHAIILKAIARGFADPAEAATSTFRWDTDLDGDFEDEVPEVPRRCVPGTPDGTTCYDLSARVVPPPVSSDTFFSYRIELRVRGRPPVYADYPVMVFADPPAQADADDNATARPQDADPEALAIMRAVAVDDALWWLHLQLAAHAGGGAGITARPASNRDNVSTGAAMLWAFLQNGHRPAYPPGTYDHQVNPGDWFRPADPPADFLTDNEKRYHGDPYSETTLRLMNLLLQTLAAFSIDAQDEGDDGTEPLPDTNDGVGLGYAGPLIYLENTGRHGAALAALAQTGLEGTVAQAGTPAYVQGRPLEAIVQQMVDYLVFAQLDSPNSDLGGWYYFPNSGQNNAPCTQWAYIGLEAAERGMGDAGVYVNSRVRSRIANILKWNQDPGTGLARWRNHLCTNHGDLDYTGGALVGCALLGWHEYAPDDVTVVAQDYAGNAITAGEARGIFDRYLQGLADNWVSYQTNCFPWSAGLWYNDGATNEEPWLRTDGRANTYTIFSTQKGLRSLAGGSGEFATVGGHDWRREIAIYYIRNQMQDGRWADNSWPDSPLLITAANSWPPEQTTALAALSLGPMPLELLENSTGSGLPGEPPEAALLSLDTGADEGETLPNGAADPHYSVIGPPGSGLCGVRAVVIDDSGPPIAPHGPWLGSSARSKWIGIAPDALAPPGTYTYQIRVTVPPELSAGALSLAGGWTAAGQGTGMRINGAPVVVETSGNPSLLDPFPPGTGLGLFVQGENVVEFIVENEGPDSAPSGLRVEARLEAAEGRLPGDCDADGDRDIADVICLILLQYPGFVLLPRRSAVAPCGGDPESVANLLLLDLDRDGSLGPLDAVYLARFLFAQGPGPFPDGCLPVIGCPPGPCP